MLKFQIDIGGEFREIELYTNGTAADIIQMLPLQLDGQPYSDIEYYGSLRKIPIYSEEAVTTQAKKGTFMYCREYNALVVVCKDHKDFFVKSRLEKFKAQFRGHLGLSI